MDAASVLFAGTEAETFRVVSKGLSIFSFCFFTVETFQAFSWISLATYESVSVHWNFEKGCISQTLPGLGDWFPLGPAVLKMYVLMELWGTLDTLESTNSNKFCVIYKKKKLQN